MKRLNGERSEESVVIDGLEVADGTKFSCDGKWIILPKTYSKDELFIGGGSFTSNSCKNGHIWIKFKEKYVWVRI